MSSQTTPHAESAGATPNELFRTIERNNGRLQVVEYACFGLANTNGSNAACLVWVIDDVLADLDRMAAKLATYPCLKEEE